MVVFVPTPIGNLQDITFRTLEAFKSADIFLCEDTRVTKKLIKLIESKITTLNLNQDIKFLSFNEHNGRERLESIKSVLKDKNIVYVSDAGMPSISDPGKLLVNYCQNSGVEYDVLPGATALTTAYTASGFGDKFLFWGFLPQKGSKREEELSKILKFETDTILYEAPHRVLKLLSEINSISSDIELFLAKELTKKYQKYYKNSAKKLFEKFKNMDIKGEWVVIIKGKKQENLYITKTEIEKMDIPPKVKAKILSKITNLSTKEWYNQLINRDY